jgi:hypothetical protein
MALHLDMEPSEGAHHPMMPLFVVVLILKRWGLELVGHPARDPLLKTLELREGSGTCSLLNPCSFLSALPSLLLAWVLLAFLLMLVRKLKGMFRAMDI